MGITLGLNIASLTAQRRLDLTVSELGKTYERLASGKRINRASDDAAGLAIADTLRSDRRVANIAIQNANQGISAIAIADSALGEISVVLTRLAELAEQSANGVFSVVQRSALSNEFTALASEIERIAVTTEFNGLKILSADQNIALQVGFDAASTSQILYSGVQATLNALGLAPTGSSKLTYSVNGITIAAGQSAARLALDAINRAIGSISSSRGVLGATGSRLEQAIINLSVARENFGAAEVRIRDADIAEESARLVRLGILQQAGAAVIGQANQQPNLALSLLS